MTKPVVVDRQLVLKFVNTQIGWLQSVIRRCKDEEVKSGLLQLLESMKRLKRGLEKDEWHPVII